MLGYGILQVNRPCHRVGVGHNVNGPRVEVPKLSQFSNGSLNVCLREQVSRAGADLAVDYVVVGAVVAHYLNLAHRGRTPFANSNFEVNGVVGNPCFDRNYVAKEVAAVEVKRRNIVPVGVAVNPCCEQLRVVPIARINSQNTLQGRVVVFRIAQKAHAAVVVGPAFFDGKDESHSGLVLNHQAVGGVAHNAGITVSGVVVCLDDEGALAVKLVIEVLRRLKNIPPP